MNMPVIFDLINLFGKFFQGRQRKDLTQKSYVWRLYVCNCCIRIIIIIIISPQL